MDTVIWVLVGVVVGVGVRVALPRGGLGGIIGDVTVGLLGASFGVYILNTVALGHVLGAYYLWVLILAGGTATGTMVAFRALTNQHGIEDDVPEEGSGPREDGRAGSAY